MTMTIEDEYITATSAAAVLGVSLAMVHYLIKVRDLPARRFGPKAWLVRRIDAERLKEEGETMKCGESPQLDKLVVDGNATFGTR